MKSLNLMYVCYVAGNLLELVGLGGVDADAYCGAMYAFVVVFGLFAYLSMCYVRFERKS